MSNNIIDRTILFKELAPQAVACPSAQYFQDVQDLIEDMSRQINALRNDNEILRKQIAKNYD